MLEILRVWLWGMAQSMGSRGGGTGRFMVGDYLVGKQVGTGSYSTVWHARHRDHGTEVAIKEIVTARLNSKLQESLMSEIVILRKINHPNIIHLHDMIQVLIIYFASILENPAFFAFCVILKSIKHECLCPIVVALEVEITARLCNMWKGCQKMIET